MSHVSTYSTVLCWRLHRTDLVYLYTCKKQQQSNILVWKHSNKILKKTCAIFVEKPNLPNQMNVMYKMLLYIFEQNETHQYVCNNIRKAPLAVPLLPVLTTAQSGQTEHRWRRSTLVFLFKVKTSSGLFLLDFLIDNSMTLHGAP